MKLSPRDQKLFDEDNKKMAERKIRIEPTISLSEEHEANWLVFDISELKSGLNTYITLPNGDRMIKVDNGPYYDEGIVVPGEDAYERLFKDLVKPYRKNIPETNMHYEWSLPSPEELEMFNAEQKELRQKNGIVTDDVIEQNTLATGQAVQNAGVVGVSAQDLSLLYGINNNVSAIYGAMGLNNSQVGDEASGSYNSFSATTEMISNINNELSFNKLFQQNSANHFIDISRDFDSVFSELYTMKGQLVSLVNEQKNVKDKLVELSKRENNCLGWVTTLSSKSNAYPNGVRVK